MPLPSPVRVAGGLTAGPVPARAVWRPVTRDGAVVDLLLDAVTGDPADLSLPTVRQAVGRTLSALFPDARVDGRLAAYCAVAESGTPLRLTRPRTAGRPRLEMVAERQPDGTVGVVSRQAPDPDPDGGTPPARAEQRWQRLFDDTPLGVLVLTLDGWVLEANRAICAMLGRDPEQVVGCLFHSFAAPEDSTRLDRELLLRTGHATLHKRYVRGDGSELWLRAATSLVLEDGEQRVLSICEDITAPVRARAELAHRADHDPLTGLHNRDALRRRLHGLLDEVAQGALPGVAVLFLDLDRFKVINDSLGHAAGDRLLREVAARLLAHCPPPAMLARLGGDEFAVVTPDPDAAAALAQRLVGALGSPFVVDGREVTVGASTGIAATRGSAGPAAGPASGPPEAGPGDPPGSSEAPVDALLRDADTAMYAAKRLGGAPVVVFDETLRRRAVARLEDEQDLRRALARGELRVHYQPVRRLADLRAEGVEALVRWQHPERGLLGPGAFLQVAEETGLVVPLGRVVLRQACADLARWTAQGGCALRVAVNVSAQQLAAGTLAADVDEALSAAGLAPEALTLEITEQGLVVSHDRAAEVLGDLRARGCRVAVDDFGTGYSSLSYLRQLPVDVLKVDRAFVADAGTDPAGGGAALLRGIVGLGAALGLEVVAEGVETEAELAAARAAGATSAQGFLLGRPAAVRP